MKSFGPTILGAIGVFTLNLLLNFITGYFSADKGVITIGPIVHIGKDMFALVSLSNLDRDPTSGLMLSIPAKTQVTSIRASAPVETQSVSDSVGNEVRKHIKVSAIEPGRVTALMMPIERKEDLSLITALNERQIQYSLESSDSVHSWLRETLYKSLITASIMALLYAAFLWYITLRQQELEKKAADLTKRLEKVSSESKERHDKATLEIAELRSTTLRIKLFYMNRISSLSKELDFWRDTIRKILYKTDGKAVETLLSDIRAHLKTYSNDSKEKDFETIEALAKSMSAIK